MQDQHRFNVKAWLLWTAGFLAFPIAGIAAEALTGRINDAGSALVGGMVAGAVIGTGQWLVARRLLDAQTWIPATAFAMGIGLVVGGWAVGYGTSVGELALMGAITGIPIGAAQAYLLRGRVVNAWLWAAAMPLLWALGWTVTTAIGVGVDTNVLVFERIREELRNGKTVRVAVQNGFERVWITILDTHATALIAAAFLFQFGTGPIKGFAVTLVIGLIANIFASYFVSKFLFEWVLGKRQVQSLSI